jgi:type IV secretion system protein VirD4
MSGPREGSDAAAAGLLVAVASVAAIGSWLRHASLLTLIGAGIAAGLMALGLGGLVVALGRRRGRGGAHWASGWELRPLRGRGGVGRGGVGRGGVGRGGVGRGGAGRGGVGRGGAAAGRLALGRHHGRVLYAEARHALVVFGPPQSGKSAALAIPALLEWNGPAIASSIKTDLLAATEACRRRAGEVLVFDPFELAGGRSHTWSPLARAGTWDGALEAAWRIAQAGELDQRGVEGGDFWAVAAEQRLAPLLYAAARSTGRIEDVVGWAYGQGGRSLDAALDAAADGARTGSEREDAMAAYEAVRAFEAQADRTRTSIEATVQALLRAYRFRRVARSAAGSEIDADRLLDRNGTLYLVGDAKASKLLRPIFLALLGEVIDRAYARAGEQGGQLADPLLVCLDEAGNVAPLPALAEVASTAPSHNIQLVSIFHDLAQARSRYGQQAETVLNAHRARLLLPGVADLETLRLFSGLVGEEEARETTRTAGAGGASRSYGQRRRPLLAPEALRQLPDNRALLLYGRLAPVVIRQRRWFEDRRLRRLARADERREVHDGVG